MRHHLIPIKIIEKHLDDKKIRPLFLSKYPDLDGRFDWYIGGISNDEVILRADVNRYKLAFSHNEAEKYLIEKHFDAYVYNTTEIAYQRGWLPDGDYNFPDNCEYCTDYDLVEELTRHGLNKDFINNWVDGETAVYTWW